MKISILLKREDFSSIFISTLSGYLREVYGDEYSVSWNKYGLFDRLKLEHSDHVFLCNPLLNAIFSTSANNSIFDLLFAWYGRSSSPIKSFIRRSYIHVATSPHTRKIFASYVIKITPAIPNFDMSLIVGGNSSIKIFDFKDNVVSTVLKDGFCDRYIMNDVQNRKRNAWLPIPSISHIFSNNKGYIEPIIKADSFCYYSDYQKKREKFQVAIDICEQLSIATEEVVDLSSYATSLIAEVRNYLLGVRAINNDMIKEIDSWVSDLEKQLAMYIPLGSKICIGQTHGDLTPGNLLLKSGEIIIVDWERTRKRINGYDALTLILQTRKGQIGGLSRLKGYLFDKEVRYHSNFSHRELSEAIKCSCSRSRKSKVYFMIYVLEELIYHLEENFCGPMNFISDGLMRYSSEIRMVDAVID